MAQLTEYVDQNSYFHDMKIIDERLSNLEHAIDNITKNIVELLNTKATNYREEKECGQKD